MEDIPDTEVQEVAKQVCIYKWQIWLLVGDFVQCYVVSHMLLVVKIFIKDYHCVDWWS